LLALELTAGSFLALAGSAFAMDNNAGHRPAPNRINNLPEKGIFDEMISYLSDLELVKLASTSTTNRKALKDIMAQRPGIPSSSLEEDCKIALEVLTSFYVPIVKRVDRCCGLEGAYCHKRRVCWLRLDSPYNFNIPEIKVFPERINKLATLETLYLHLI
jgi:hypothetical protein